MLTVRIGSIGKIFPLSRPPSVVLLPGGVETRILGSDRLVLPEGCKLLGQHKMAVVAEPWPVLVGIGDRASFFTAIGEA